jgi:hypothetical protein
VTVICAFAAVATTLVGALGAGTADAVFTSEPSDSADTIMVILSDLLNQEIDITDLSKALVQCSYSELSIIHPHPGDKVSISAVNHYFFL